MVPRIAGLAVLLLAVLAADARCDTAASQAAASLRPGSVQLTSVGPLAFGPEGVLLVSDPLAATIYAIAVDDAPAGADRPKVEVTDIRQKIASLLAAQPQDIQINDLAVSPRSGQVYLSVARGSGPDAMAVLVRVDAEGAIHEVPLENVRFAKAELPNPPEASRGRRGDPRMLAVTDIAYVDGRVFIAGLSNEEFASKLRSIPFPFGEANEGTSVEIYHGSHGQIETRSPIMTFVPYEIGSEPHILAAYTCTPLVSFRVADLEPGSKVRGRTVAELGNRNRPLDMFVYQKDGRAYILMANSSRGVMKITTEQIEDVDSIAEPVPDGRIAGLPFETIEELQGVMQLDRLDDTTAVVLVQGADGAEHLRTIALP